MSMLTLALTLAPVRAWADEPRAVGARRLEIHERGHKLTVSGTFTDVFDQVLLERLSSGFATTILVRAYLFRKGQRAPISQSAATVRVIYDLWDEAYLVQVRDPTGERNSRHATRAEALRTATSLQGFPIADLSVVGLGVSHQLAVIVEVNPLSQEVIADVRRWLARPSAGTSLAGRSSFFGSFVSVLVNPKIEEAESTLRFRSQWFTRGAK
ncbi:MAG: DUF4390 domain-containing protein [Deltaproteobacteria bacterium]|nr:DUF4390 domain-containing protein [Deltaproteobacteria bacterium]